MFSIAFAVFLGLGALTLPASAQSTAPRSPASNDAPVIFHSELLDLSFAYPNSLAPIQLSSPAEQHAEAARNSAPSANPLLAKINQCTDSALVALRTDNPDHPTGASGPVLAAFLHISRVGVDCIPEVLRSDLDGLVSAFALSRAKGKNLESVGDPITYRLGTTVVHLDLAQDIATAGHPPSHYVASAAFLSNGSLVFMNFDCTDIPFLKRMLSGTITLGKQPPSRFFPPENAAVSPH